MKKHMVSAVLLLIMMLSLSAQAAEMRVITASPYLTFNENTATCMADCKSTNPSDKVSANIDTLSRKYLCNLVGVVREMAESLFLKVVL